MYFNLTKRAANITSQWRTSQPSILAWMEILIQSWAHTCITYNLKVEVIPYCPTLNLLLIWLLNYNLQDVVQSRRDKFAHNTHHHELQQVFSTVARLVRAHLNFCT